MTVLINDFEGGTSGTTVSTGNSNSGSGNTFDAVSVGTGSAVTYDNTEAAHGSLACKVSTGTSAGNAAVEWTTSIGTVTQVWFREYLYFTANPAANTRVLGFTSSGSAVAFITVTTTGKLTFDDSTNTVSTTSTNSIPLNAWFRIEGYVACSATAGQTELKLFSTMDSTTPTETDTSNATFNTLTSLNALLYGNTGSQASRGPYWLDDIAASTTGYIGPVVSSLLLTNSSEGGSNGVGITATNSGGASGNAYDYVLTNNSATITYDTTHAAHGLLAVNSTTSTTNGSSYVSWSTAPMGVSVSQVWFRVYCYLTAVTGNDRLVSQLSGAGTLAGAIQLASTSPAHFRILDSAGSTQATSVTVIPTNAWFRLEGYFIGSASAGQGQLEIFTTMDSATPTETITTGTINTTGLLNWTRFGNPSSVASYTLWMDDLGLSTTGYIGPVISAAPMGSTLGLMGVG